jgi:beta-glucanase (GH16 family)
VVAGAAVLALLLGAAHVPASATMRSGVRRAPPAGMHLVFSDDFAGPTLDTDRWDTCYPWADKATGCTNYGNPELEWNLPSQVQLSNHTLHLVTDRAPTPGRTRRGSLHTYDFRSGMITTYRSLAFKYGYVSVEARPPVGDGLWSALWLLPTSLKWPPEIDIAAIFGNDTRTVHVTYHPVRGAQHIRNPKLEDQSTGLHTYAVDWEPRSITWSIDGKQVYRYRGPTPHQRMYFLAGLAVAYLDGAKAAGGPPPSASLDIAKVEIYQR